MKSIMLLVLLLSVQYSQAQETYNEDKKHIVWNYVRANFDDDLFNIAGKGTDQYYTAGWQADACYKRNDSKTPFTDALLMKLPGGSDIFFYGISRRIYTPANIDSPTVPAGDRPYASVFTVQHGLISVNREKNETLTTEIGLGAIGPITHGGEIQKWFHRMINNDVPKGWNTQIKNNVIIDYRMNYEKQIYNPAPGMKILANIDCEAGTLTDNAGLGATLALGRFNNSLAKEKMIIPNDEVNCHKLLIHFYIHPTVRTVLYNATLEGGFFSAPDRYAINKNNLDYIYMQLDAGVVMVYRRLGFSYTQKTRTAEFTTGTIQQVGCFTMSIPI